MKKKKVKKIKVSEVIKNKKEHIAYKTGRRDAAKLLKQYSLWVVCSMTSAWGLIRKKSMENLELWLYCDGLQNCIDREVKRRGLKERGDYGYIDCKDIGKGENRGD